MRKDSLIPSLLGTPRLAPWQAPSWRSAQTPREARRDGVHIQMKFYSGASRSKVRRSDCASAALSKMCGATPRFSSASPSFMRRKPLVV